LQAAAAMSFRSGASRTLILLTDESVDCSERNGSYPLSMSGTLGTLAANGFTVHAIACDCTDPAAYYSCGYDCGTRCNGADLPGLANGLFMDIAAPVSAWSSFLSQLGAAVASYSNIVLEDPFPPQLNPIPGQLDGGVISGGSLVWSVSTLGRGDSLQRCFLSTVDPGFSGAITNTASVSADGVTPSTAVAVPIYYVTPTPTITPSFTVTPTHSITPTLTITNTFTITFTHTITPTHSVTPSFTASPTVTPTPTATPPPLSLALYPPNPNPSDNGVWLPYRLGTDADVDVKVWTVAGEPVCEWPEGFKRMGLQEAFWDHKNAAGTKVGSGVFIYRIHARSPAGEEVQQLGKCAVRR
jgi:hypothetical protein